MGRWRRQMQQKAAPWVGISAVGEAMVQAGCYYVIACDNSVSFAGLPLSLTPPGRRRASTVPASASCVDLVINEGFIGQWLIIRIIYLLKLVRSASLSHLVILALSSISVSHLPLHSHAPSPSLLISSG